MFSKLKFFFKINKILFFLPFAGNLKKLYTITKKFFKVKFMKVKSKLLNFYYIQPKSLTTFILKNTGLFYTYQNNY